MHTIEFELFKFIKKKFISIWNDLLLKYNLEKCTDSYHGNEMIKSLENFFFESSFFFWNQLLMDVLRKIWMKTKILKTNEKNENSDKKSSFQWWKLFDFSLGIHVSMDIAM